MAIVKIDLDRDEKMTEIKIHTASRDLLQKMIECLIAAEDPLMQKILDYAITFGYAKYTSTLKEAWRISISGLTDSFVNTLKANDFVIELGPDQDFRADPVATFAIVEARRHRRRGIRLEMFLGFLKYYRQSFREVIKEYEAFNSDENEVCSYIIDKLFDRIEIGFCAEWSSSSATHLNELQSGNRTITNEKNKYLTIFESLPFPVIILNSDSMIDNLNHAAALWLGNRSIPGAFYYGTKLGPALISNMEENNGPAVHHLPDWLVPEIEIFTGRKDCQYHSFEKKIVNDNEELLFIVQLSKMLDISGKFTGCIVMVADFTEAHKAEKERARMKEQLLQSDKMASIGQLAAGVAHEINNPIGFIASNLNRLGEYTTDMIDLIHHCRQLMNTMESVVLS